MEKRWCKRLSIATDVEIYHNGHKLSKCKTKNISLCGVCLNSGPISFHQGAMVQIKFLEAGRYAGNMDTISANIARDSRNEIGLVFNPTEPDLLNAIFNAHKNDFQLTVSSRA